MTSIFVRINDVISANISEMIDKVEDPERMIRQIIREMEDNIVRSKEGVIDALTSEKQLARELEHHRRQAEKWHKKAETALRSDNEGLAREALARKKEHDRIVEDTEVSWKAARNTSKNLKAQLHALENKLTQARCKRGTLVARKRSAEARQCMDQTRHRFRKGLELDDKFIRMEDRIMEIEARTDAIAELADEDSELERDIDALEVELEVENELAQLRKKIDN